jgi:putative spermidine/putrescine transport system ATP-binding protein
VFNRPATAFVARFMGDHNVLAGRVTQATGSAIRFESPEGLAFTAPPMGAEIGQPIEIAVRNDRVRIGREPVTGCSLTGLVQSIEYHGQKVQVALSAPGVDEFALQLPESDFFSAPLNVGDAVPLTWAPEDVHVLKSSATA